MPEYGSPAVRRRRLAAELRRLRERAGFRGEQVAEQLGWSASKVSRIELHRTGIKQRDLRQLLDLYGVQDEKHRESLIALAEESSKANRLDLATASLPEEYAASVIAEAEAQSVWTWDPLIVPGLLQTADYARSVMSGWREMFPVPPGEIERRVEARLLRQRVLAREPVFTLATVIDESERKGTPRGLFWPWCAANIAVLAVSYGAFLLGFGISLWRGIWLERQRRDQRQSRHQGHDSVG